MQATHGAASAAVDALQKVSTAGELMAALAAAAEVQGPGTSTLELQQDIVLSLAAANQSLPLEIGHNRTLRMLGGEETCWGADKEDALGLTVYQANGWLGW